MLVLCHKGHTSTCQPHQSCVRVNHASSMRKIDITWILTFSDCCCHLYVEAKFRLICDVLRCFKFQVLCDISQDIRPGYEGYWVESLDLHQAGRKPEMGETWEPEPGLSYRTSRTLILAEQRLSWPSPPRPEEGHGNMACLLIH